MKSLTPSRVPGLDTLRAAAIVSVVLFHLQNLLPPALSAFRRLGWLGVDLFFVLSGFLIGWQLLKPLAAGHPLDVPDFYRRRAYRILPAYLTVLALYVFVPVWREKVDMAPAWKFLTFLYNLTLRFPSELAFSHAWSLCVEEHFYLLLPLLLLLMRRRSTAGTTVAAFASILLAGIAIRTWELTHAVRNAAVDDTWRMLMTRIYYPTYSRLDGLLFGVLLATVRAFRPGWWNRAERHGWSTIFAGIALLSLGMWTFRFDYPTPDGTLGIVFGFPLVAAGFAFCTLSSVAKNGPLSMRLPGARMAATLAFSLYLTHKEAAHLAAQAFPWLEGNRSWSAAAVYALACVTVAATLYRCVEAPCLRLRDRRLPGAHPSATEANIDPAL